MKQDKGMREEDIEKLKKIENKLFKIFAVLLIVVVICVILLFRFYSRDDAEMVEFTQSDSQEVYLDDSTYLFPDYCSLNQQIPDFPFVSETGESYSVSDFEGELTIVTFWASWCPDCVKELDHIHEFMEIVNQYENVNYILVNKLDHDRETKEQAINYLAEKEILLANYFDDGLVAYDMLGIHNIPTTLFIDEEGVLRALYYKEITDTSVFEAYLENLLRGSGTITGEFVEGYMMDSKGGVHSLYNVKEEKTWEESVLSESQGALLEYAVLKDDQDLFDQVYGYIESQMLDEHLTAWIVENGEASDVNALVDDFRIYSAIVEANEKWGGYETKVEYYQASLKRYGIDRNRFVDFYDSEHKSYAERFTLCYGDFNVMELLANKDDDFEKAYEEALQIVSNGMISEEFPLYYSWYNYDTKKYEESEMNMAEAMLTLYHLAEVGMLQEETLAWLNDTITTGGIKSRYYVDGSVVSGYNYESTAVYALVAMIGAEVGDLNLCSEALKKMEKMRVVNMKYEYNGSFGSEDGTGIYSFDQVMAMLAYEYTYGIVLTEK